MCHDNNAQHSVSGFSPKDDVDGGGQEVTWSFSRTLCAADVPSYLHLTLSTIHAHGHI